MRFMSTPEVIVIILVGGLLFYSGHLNQQSHTATVITDPDPEQRSAGGGGGGSSPTTSLAGVSTGTTITEIAICKEMNNNVSCDQGIYPDTTTAYLFWRVDNGVGCCNTYSCNFDVFKVACLYPEFKLYSVAVDGVPQTVNYEEYDYSCSTATPWNWFKLINLTEGEHVVTVIQRDCHIDVANRSIMFNITKVNGVYVLEQQAI